MKNVLYLICFIWGTVNLIKYFTSRRNYPTCVKTSDGEYCHYLRLWHYNSGRLRRVRLLNVDHYVKPLVKDGSYVNRGQKVVVVEGNLRPTGRPKIESFFIKAKKDGYIHYHLYNQGIDKVIFVISQKAEARSMVLTDTRLAENQAQTSAPKTVAKKTPDYTNLWPESVPSSGNDVRMSASLFDEEDRRNHNPKEEYFYVDVTSSSVKQYHFVQENDRLGKIAHGKGFFDKSVHTSVVTTHKAGWIGRYWDRSAQVNGVICSIYDTPEDLVRKELLDGIELFTYDRDEFTGATEIIANKPVMMEELKLSMIYKNGQAMMQFDYNMDSRVTMTRNDSVTFLFEGGNTVTMAVETNMAKSAGSRKDRLCLAVMDKEALDALAERGVKKFKISGPAHEDIIVKSGTLYPAEVLKVLLREEAAAFRDKLTECGVCLGTREETEMKDQGCYVYIMRDEKNGCFKIGISNRPEYREKTLQSDKPFIVMLRAKEFPTRKMAHAFEQSLHKVYEQKHIRGEWFSLNEDDVREVMDALK